jgi:hypothetical protein
VTHDVGWDVNHVCDAAPCVQVIASHVTRLIDEEHDKKVVSDNLVRVKSLLLLNAELVVRLLEAVINTDVRKVRALPRLVPRASCPSQCASIVDRASSMVARCLVPLPCRCTTCCRG